MNPLIGVDSVWVAISVKSELGQFVTLQTPYIRLHFSRADLDLDNPPQIWDLLLKIVFERFIFRSILYYSNLTQGNWIPHPLSRIFTQKVAKKYIFVMSFSCPLEMEVVKCESIYSNIWLRFCYEYETTFESDINKRENNQYGLIDDFCRKMPIRAFQQSPSRSPGLLLRPHWKSHFWSYMQIQ